MNLGWNLTTASSKPQISGTARLGHFSIHHLGLGVSGRGWGVGCGGGRWGVGGQSTLGVIQRRCFNNWSRIKETRILSSLRYISDANPSIDFPSRCIQVGTWTRLLRCEIVICLKKLLPIGWFYFLSISRVPPRHLDYIFGQIAVHLFVSSLGNMYCSEKTWIK